MHDTCHSDELQPEAIPTPLHQEPIQSKRLMTTKHNRPFPMKDKPSSLPSIFRRTGVLLVLLSFLTTSAEVSNAFAVEFTASGNLAWTSHEGNPQRPPTRGEFKVYVHDNKWKITVKQYEQSLTLLMEMGSEDGKIMSVGYTVSQTNDTKTPSFAVVRPGPVPKPFAGYMASPVWLAFCSSTYFSGITNNQAEPLFRLEGHALDDCTATMPTQFKLSKEAPHLPQSVVYRNDGFTRFWTNEFYELIERSPKATSFPKPYDRGFTNLTYEICLLSRKCG
jgi:hypothetical protein